MSDNKSAPTNPQFQSPSTADLVPRLPQSISKTQLSQQISPAASTEQTSVTPVKWMSKQKASAIGHFTKLTHRGGRTDQVGVATESGVDPAEWPSQALHAVRTSVDTRSNDENVGSVVADNPGQSQPEPVVPSTFAKKAQDVFSAIPSFASSFGSGSSRPTPPAPSQTEVNDTPVRDPHLENGLLEHGWQSFWSTLDRLGLSYGKKPETSNGPEPSQDDVLDCIDDNNSIMMYGPLEPDDSSEVEIACSEIVSINGDGEEIRTPQPRFIPLPSESFDEDPMGSGGLSPLPRFIPLPLESVGEALMRSRGRSPQPRFVPLPLESINEMLMRSGGRSPRPRFVPLPSESIDQVLMGGGGELSNVRGTESESKLDSGTSDTTQVPPTTEPTAGQPPTKEYRVWLPSLTKLSVQTMWWGFRIYLPPPVLHVLNNRQLEAAKRAALITTALQWLMDHLPVSLLPPQMRPGVAILRHLVPYVGYMGGFIAWSWSAIRSFDKGYGVVLTATWLLPFILVPGTWEVDEVPTQNAGTQPSPSVSS